MHGSGPQNTGPDLSSDLRPDLSIVTYPDKICMMPRRSTRVQRCAVRSWQRATPRARNREGLQLTHAMQTATSLSLADLPEGELVTRAANGDDMAFETIMRRHNQLLFRTARSVVRHDSEAEDVVQEAYLRAWRALGSFRHESRLSTWLIRITTNEALGRLRRRSAQTIPLETAMASHDPHMQAALTQAPDAGPEQTASRGQMRRLMEARIDELPDAYRTVFVLRALEDMTVEDIALALEIPPATVRTRFFRARGLMRESLTQAMDTSLPGAFAFDGARCDRMVAGVMARGRAEGLIAAKRC